MRTVVLYRIETVERGFVVYRRVGYGSMVPVTMTPGNPRSKTKVFRSPSELDHFLKYAEAEDLKAGKRLGIRVVHRRVLA